MENVLFSAVGTSDPVSKGFDGSLLHIVRRYKPRKVYLFFTQAMANHCDSVKRAISYVSPECDTECIFTDIVDAHDFDAFSGLFNEYLSGILGENPGGRVLLNISSGTPQIKVTLCLLVLSRGRLLTPVQVADPDTESGRKGKPFDPDSDDIDYEMENNLDNLSDAENRCSEPDLLFFRKVFIEAQVKGLIKTKEYAGAHALVNNEPEFSQRVKDMILYGCKRVTYNTAEAEKLAKNLGLYEQLYVVDNPRAKTVCEYFLITQFKEEKGEMTDVLLRIKPLAEYLAYDFIRKENKMIIKVSKYRVSLSQNAEKYYPGIFEHMDNAYEEKYGGYDKSRDLNLDAYINIAKFVSGDRNQEALKRFEKINEFAKDRNSAAHTLECPEVNPKDIRSTFDDLRFIIKNVYGNHVSDKIFNIYDVLNNLIENELAGV